MTPPTRVRRDARGPVARGPRWPRIQLGTTRTLFLVAFLGAAIFLAWGILDQGRNQVAILVAGLLIMTLTFASLAVGGAMTAYRAGSQGRGARAFWAALLGGMAALAAWGCLAAAAVLALLYT
ncbi:MAG: hypothetical protein ACLQHS_09160 [Candidatus Limnocylindrales bacterium]|jgi:hypothetical protein